MYVPAAGSSFTDLNGKNGGTITGRPFEVAPDGNTVVYPGYPPPSGGGGSIGQGNGDEYLARRSPGGGWTAADIQPVGSTTKYTAFSSDLALGVLDEFNPLTADAPAPCEVLYSRTNADGAFHAAFTTTQTPGECGFPEFAGVSSDESHLLFESTAALIPSATAEQSNLYESVAGQLTQVNVLPNDEIAGRASFGSPSFEARGFEHKGDLGQVISADGSRIFWTALNGEGQPEALYVRENNTSADAVTVQLDAPEPGCASCVGGAGRFLTASSDGSKVLFTDENRLTSDSSAGSGEPDLYEFDVGTVKLTDLTIAEAGKHADVKGLMGASDDGAYVYFVAGGVLAGNENSAKEQATPGSCREAEEGSAELQEEKLGRIPLGRACNLYLVHDGEPPRFIAALPAIDDNEVIPVSGGTEEKQSGDWEASPGYRTAEVTPDGHGLIFMTRRSLTGYGNEISYREPFFPSEMTTRAVEEVFVYEADAGAAGTLSCVSCNPKGEAPVSTEFNTFSRFYAEPIGAYVPITKTVFPGDTHQVRGITDDGSRVFFDSGEPLVPQDTNGWMDVYEWERDGSGTCRESRGCLYLLSGGTSVESSWLLGADASGENVFIITRAQLVTQDRNDNMDVYDARVGGVRPPSPPVCSGAGCEGASPAQPIFATPSSTTFNGGGGNFPPPPPPAVSKPKPKPKPKPVKCRKGHVKKHGRCIKKKKVKKSAIRRVK